MLAIAAVLFCAGNMLAQHTEFPPAFKATEENLETRYPAQRGQSEITWLTSETESTAWGNTLGSTLKAVMEFTPSDIGNFEDLTITAINQISFFLNSQYVYTITSARAVIMQGATIQTATEHISQDIEISALTGGWNSVTLTSPYTVDATKSLYIGYEIATYTGGYPMSLAGGNNPKQGWIYGGSWQNIATDNHQFMIKAMATVTPNVNLAIRLTSLNIPSYAVVNTNLTVEGTILNRGLDNIASFSASYMVNGTTVEQDFTGLNIASMETYNFAFTTPYELNQLTGYEFTVTVSSPNGEDNNDNNTLTATVEVLTTLDIPKRVLHEGFSSSTCGPCTMGNQQLKEILDDADPEKFVNLKYQMNYPSSGDPYYTAESNDKRLFYGVSGIPDMFVDGVNNISSSQYSLEQLNELAAVPAKAEMSATISRDGKTVSADITVTPLTSSSGNVRLFAVIAEKSTVKNIGSNGEYIFYNIMKKFMTQTDGNAIDFGSVNIGEPITASLSYQFKGNYRLPENASNPIDHDTEHSVEIFNNLEVVYWLQDIETKEIWQAGVAYPPSFPQVTIDVLSNPAPGGYITGIGSNQHDQNSHVTVKANAYSNYNFVNWTVNGNVVSTDAEYTFTAANDTTLTANFALKQFAVTFNTPENGTLAVTAGGASVNSGDIFDINTVLTITATPDEGYWLQSLKVNGKDFESGKTHKIITDVLVEALFTDDVGIDSRTMTGITVYGNEGNVYIVNKNNIQLKSVEITDVLGRVVYSGKANTSVEIPVNEAGGIYIVRLVSEDGKISSEKVHLTR